MENSTIEETTATQPTESRKRGCLHPWVVAVLAILLLLAVAGLSAYLGYGSGMDKRKSFAATQGAQAVQTQFALAVQDIDAERLGLSRQRLEWFQSQTPGARNLTDQIAIELQVQYQFALEDIQAERYAMAQMRLEWIIEWQPDFPGAAERLADVLYYLRVTATPTLAPTLTLTPTPDNRGKEKLYTDAQQALTAGSWSVAIDTLLTLRKVDPTYMAVQVDGMLFRALRYRGVDKIKGNGKTDPTITGVDLAGGMYDLTLARQFGLLDQEAQQWSKWADWYIKGASFWEADWPRVISYFEMLSREAPYLSDGSKFAMDRYREALVKYGDWLARQDRWCEAQEQYQKAMDAGANPAIQPTATYAGEKCSPPSGGETTPTPTAPGEQTATPPIEAATPTPTSTVKAPPPTETPTSTSTP